MSSSQNKDAASREEENKHSESKFVFGLLLSLIFFANFYFLLDEQLRRDRSHVAKYGLIENDDDPQPSRSSINLGETDNEVLTTGQSLEPYLQSYVTIPPTSDVSSSPH